MKKYLSKIFTLLLLGTFLISCKNYRADVNVINKVHNVELTQIRIKNYSLGYSLKPGESLSKTLIGEKTDFPIYGQIEFTMNRNGKTVYLNTNEYFTIDLNSTIEITISDTTSVYSPVIN